MNITTYDYDVEQEKVANDPPPVMPPAGRFGADGPSADDGSGAGADDFGGDMDGVVHKTETPIHGTGKKKLKNQLNNV